MKSLIRTLVLMGFIALAGLTHGAEPSGTHKQQQVFQPKHANRTVNLHTFCLSSDGKILASVTATKNYLQIYSSDFELLQETELPFAATALNIAPNGTIFAAGSGKIAMLTSVGELQGVHNSPQLSDESAMRERLLKVAKDRAEKAKESYRKQIDTVTKRIEKLEGSEDELTERDKKRLDTYKRQKEMLEDNLSKYEAAQTEIDPASIAAPGIRAIAVTSEHLFICCNSMEGPGYEVWKSNLDLAEPKLLVEGLGGCCGQFDIQATEDLLVLAENTKFQVGIMNHDGKRLTSFGKSNRMGGDGFGSCCNPMNLRCCENGDILTAESSIGTIKRFNRDGELIGTIGKAKIGGGCKHVAMGYDQTRDRYYMQYQDKNAICVLVPKGEIEGESEEEQLAKQAREGLGQKLVGKWSAGGKKKSSGLFGALGSALAGGQAVDPFLGNDMEFKADGSLVGSTSEFKWVAVRQDENKLVATMEIEDVGYELRIQFKDDDAISISVYLGGDEPYSTKNYKRVTDDLTKAEPSSNGGE